MSGPLSGLRVVDFSTTQAGGHVSRLFGDFGAEVIGVEPPGGSALRHDPAWAFWGRGRRSVVLDLAADVDRDRAAGLASRADVVVQAWRPGVAERLGLDHESLAERNGRVITVSITGFGTSGPDANTKGYEALVMARLGALSEMHTMAERDGPAFLAAPYASFGAAQHALHGALAALHERERSGSGQKVEVTLVQGIAAHDPWNWFLLLIALQHPDAYRPGPPVGEDGLPNHPFAMRLLVSLTADGRWLQFSQTMPRLFQAFMRSLGLDWMFDDPEWSAVPDLEDRAKRSELWDRMLEAVKARTLAEWEAIYEEEPDIWGELFRSGAELLDHPQMLHDGRDMTIDGIRQPGPIVRFDTTPVDVPRAAPGIDADRSRLDEILTEALPTSPPAQSAGSEPPLADLTVLELGTFYAAPFGGTILAELGARVIKVETLDGEPMRGIVGFPEVGAIKSLQGKESIAVDLTTTEGRAIVEDLARRADIVLQSFRAGAAARLGVDRDRLRALNPDLIYLDAPGYGRDGPCGARPAFAPTIGAGAGLGAYNAGDSIPERADLSIEEIRHHSVRLAAATQTVGNADGCAALAVATALLLGVVSRDRRGQPEAMLTSMLSTMAHVLCDDTVVDPDAPDRRPVDADLLGLGPRYRLYETSDGWVFLAAPRDDEWDTFLSAAGLPADADEAAIEALLATRTAAEWERDLLAADVGCVEVAEGSVVARLLDDDFGRARGFVVDVEHPTIGRHPRLAPLRRLSRSAAVVAPGCTLGQHSATILFELGYDANAIADLRERGILGG